MVYRNQLASQRGTELHEFASHAIKLGEKLARKQNTLNLYVNDAIRFGMEPEVVLFYSFNAYGSADAISFRNNMLRIHDLKTGKTATSFKQLMVYVALFCLEYKVEPAKIGIELRIYQEDEVQIYVPQLDEIVHIMDRIVSHDKRIQKIREAELQ